MAQKKEDEIMAEYLLKGGKMLEKTCRQCSCPQFEYKGKTLCVVCAERELEKKGTAPAPAAGQKVRETKKAAVFPAGSEPTSTAAGEIGPVLAATILDLCRRIQEEDDPERCLALMDAIRTGTEALQILKQM